MKQRRAEVFASMELGAGEDTDRFVGGPNAVEFSGTVWDEEGFRIPSRIRLQGRDSALVALVAGQRPLALAADLSASRFGYLLDYGANATFVDTWESKVSLPLALRVLLARGIDGQLHVDTLLFWIAGGRR